MATDTEIVDLLEAAVGAYPQCEITEATGRAWQDGLMDLPIATLWLAFRAHRATSSFFPTIHELRRRALEAQTGLREFPNAYAAWERVSAEVQRVGHIGEPKFAQPLVAEVVGQIGWRTLCLSPNADEVRARFIQVYDRLLARETDKALLPPAVRDVLYPTSAANPALATPAPPGLNQPTDVSPTQYHV